MDTIYALASALGKAGVAVIRISGPCAWDAARSLCKELPEPRSAGTRVLYDADNAVIDHALVLTFQGPASFTGEDVVEFQTHGSVAIVRSVLSNLSLLDGLRLAEPGEFTRRALVNNRLNLTQVEGLSDLIEAETEAQRKQAVQVFAGAFGERVEGWRKDLIRAAALLEATIDFADEEVPVDVTPEVVELIEKVSSEIVIEIQSTKVAERIRSGFEVAIVGSPNVGKSTLLNALAGREAAITSEIAGTTRDVIEVRMDIAGLPITILDTAGLRESDDTVEDIGIRRGIERARQADLRVFLAYPGEELMLQPEADDLVLHPKVDQEESVDGGISGMSGEGIPQLIDFLTSYFENKVSAVGLATHERHRVALLKSQDELAEAETLVSQGPELYDIAAEELRTAIRTLEALVGRIDVENLLDEIFSSFCVGK